MLKTRLNVTPYYLSRVCRLTACLCAATLLLTTARWLQLTSPVWTVLPPLSARHLEHLRRSRHLHDYVDEKRTSLISPQSGYCAGMENIDVVALVSSSADHVAQREAVRATWGAALPTYFFIGRTGNGQLNVDEDMISLYIEAKQHGDMIVGDYLDSYENLTLKTAHMVQWAARNCPNARFVLKTDDDVLVNPWTLREVARENYGSHLVGYKLNGSTPHRDMESKWYLPKWLYRPDLIPEYLSGTGYLINGDLLYKLVDASNEVPLINLEDVYLTYLVAKQHLKLTLTHDRRLSPFQPIVASGCAFFKMASVHSVTAKQMLAVWPKIQKLSAQYDEGRDPCYLFDKMFGFLSSDEFLV